MLKKIIKTHTARLDFCLYYRTYFFYETLSFTNRERRVIASFIKIYVLFWENGKKIFFFFFFFVKIFCDKLEK